MLPENKHILLFAGHQIWQKNLKLVLDTTEILKKMSGDYLTVIAGCGYNQKAIMRPPGKKSNIYGRFRCLWPHISPLPSPP